MPPQSEWERWAAEWQWQSGDVYPKRDDEPDSFQWRLNNMSQQAQLDFERYMAEQHRRNEQHDVNWRQVLELHRARAREEMYRQMVRGLHSAPYTAEEIEAGPAPAPVVPAPIPVEPPPITVGSATRTIVLEL